MQFVLGFESTKKKEKKGNGKILIVKFNFLCIKKKRTRTHAHMQINIHTRTHIHAHPLSDTISTYDVRADSARVHSNKRTNESERITFIQSEYSKLIFYCLFSYYCHHFRCHKIKFYSMITIIVMIAIMTMIIIVIIYIPDSKSEEAKPKCTHINTHWP